MPISLASTPPDPCRRSATEAVLSLPEILLTIFKFLFREACTTSLPAATQALSTVIRVNRLWFECGTEELWSGEWAVPQLLRLSPHRRNLYASKIGFLLLDCSQINEFYPKLKDVQFSRLQEVHIGVFRETACDVQCIEPYCVPSLQSFKFSGPDIDIGVLHYLRATCRRLRTFYFYVDNCQITAPLFLEFIRDAPLLQTVVLSVRTGSDSAVSAELLLYLAQSKNLFDLEIPWRWTAHGIERVAAAARHMDFIPFPALEELALSAPSTVIDSLITLVMNLKDLRLIVKDSRVDVLRHVSRLVGLRNLELSFECSTVISVGALSSLRDLPQLESLTLRPLFSLDTTVIESDFSDGDCEALVSHWPSLSYLEFRVQCNLSTNALISIARHCRDLSWYELSQALDTRDFFSSDYDEILFPKLISLQVGGLVGEEIMRSVWIPMFGSQPLGSSSGKIR
ncbi:hypothetical protein V8C37DRAFT_403286 [Trichoderma ceciliae]